MRPVSTLFILVNVGWVFFRSPDLSSAFAFFKQLFVEWHIPFAQFVEAYMVHPVTTLGIKNVDLTLSLCFISILLLVEGMQKRGRLGVFLDTRSPFVLSVLYSSLAPSRVAQHFSYLMRPRARSTPLRRSSFKNPFAPSMVR